MDASHVSTTGSAADDWETRLRIMNEDLTFSERLEYLDDPDWTAFISASDSCDQRSTHTEIPSDPTRSTQLVDSHAESRTISDYINDHSYVDSPVSGDGKSQDTIYEITSVRQESHRSMTSLTTSQDSDSNVVSTFKCTDCPKQYKRKTDLNRHAKRHDTRGRLDCPISTCKFRGRKGNPRRDKFIDHLLKGHPEVGTWPCPEANCSTTWNFLLFGVHLDGHGHSSLGRSMVKALSITKTKCPIERCGKPLTPNHLFEHHTQMERQTEADSLNALGFDHRQSALLCPACDMKFLCSMEDRIWIKKDLPKLREHVREKHLGYEYEFQVQIRHFHVQESDRLLSMWKDPHTLYHCREQLLRLDASYVTHAIFRDMRNPSS